MKKGIQDIDIYNMDETCFQIETGKDVSIITRDKHKKLFISSANNQESITVIETISASGSVIPLMIILPGIIIMENWFTRTGIPDSYLLATSD